MKDELNYIDEFYKDNLKGYEAKAETDVWGKMKWRLFWWRYKNFLMAGTIVVLGSLAIVLPLATNDTNIDLPQTSEVAEIKIVEQTESSDIINQANKPSQQDQQSTIVATNENNEESDVVVDETFVSSESSSRTETYTTVVYTANEANTTTESFSEEYSTYSNRAYLNFLESADITFLNYMFPDTTLMGMNRRTNIIAPGVKTQWVSLNIFAGPAYNQSYLSSFDSEYLNLRNSNEANSNSYSFGADIKFHIKNFVITSGLNYVSYKQNRYYSRTYQVYNPEGSYYEYDTSWVYVYDPPDYGTPVVSSIDSTWKKVYNDVTDDNSGINRVEYFEIPLLLGYRFNHKLLTFEINAGASAGFLVYSHFKAPSFSNNDEIVEITDMNKTMFNIIGNISVYYQINRRTSLFVSPYYKQNLNSIYKEYYPINQKFKTFGLNFGINMKF